MSPRKSKWNKSRRFCARECRIVVRKFRSAKRREKRRADKKVFSIAGLIRNELWQRARNKNKERNNEAASWRAKSKSGGEERPSRLASCSTSIYRKVKRLIAVVPASPVCANATTFPRRKRKKEKKIHALRDAIWLVFFFYRAFFFLSSVVVSSV